MSTSEALARLQLIIDRKKGGKCTKEELFTFLENNNVPLRANALLALVPLGRNDPEIIRRVAQAATDPTSDDVIMGGVTIAFIAIECLIRIGTPEALTLARSLIESYAGFKRETLEYCLKSENLWPLTTPS